MSETETDATLDKLNSGCATQLVLFGAAAITLVLCGLLSNLVGQWLLFAWFVTWLIVFSWRRFGPIGALLYLAAAAVGWWMIIQSR